MVTKYFKFPLKQKLYDASVNYTLKLYEKYILPPG